jgi:hypothetical protein
LAQSLRAIFIRDDRNRRAGFVSALNPESAMPSKAKRKGKTKKNPPAKRRKNKNIPPPQTNEPFEQEADRPIGQHGSAGRPPLMKK